MRAGLKIRRVSPTRTTFVARDRACKAFDAEGFAGPCGGGKLEGESRWSATRARLRRAIMVPARFQYFLLACAPQRVPPLSFALPRACLEHPRKLLRAHGRGLDAAAGCGEELAGAGERRARGRREHGTEATGARQPSQPAARRRRQVLGGDAAIDARVVEVVVLVPILTDERLAREEENVVPVGARVSEVGLIVAFPGRDQVQTAAGAFAEARARTGAAVAPTAPLALPLETSVCSFLSWGRSASFV